MPAIVVSLAPLGAYKLLGPAVSDVDGPLVAVDHIVGADDQGWARIAAESGYADQPHLIREFRR